MNIWWDWLPLCLFKWFEENISNLQTEKIMYMSETYEDKIYNTDYWVREYSGECDECKLKESCSGNFKIYNDLYWDKYLLPLK
jgi:radical SAM protein with 4Fe4S-binding SPASM domain